MEAGIAGITATVTAPPLATLLVTLLLAVAIGYFAFVALPRRGQAADPSLAPSLAALNWVVSTLAGTGVQGFENGACADAQFKMPYALAPLPDGSVVVVDTWNDCIRLVSGGAVTTLAGIDGKTGFVDGPAAAARFNHPRGVVVGADSAIFVADMYNHRIRRIKDGAVTTFAGSGEEGGVDGVGASASFSFPSGLALGPGGVLFVTEHRGHRVRKISPAGAVTTLAGGFNGPSGIAVDASGVVFIADQDNHIIRRITNGAIDTLAGNGAEGFADGVGAAAQFNHPDGLVLDRATGNLLVADWGNRIRAINPRSGAVSTLAGSGDLGSANGNKAAASFNLPRGVAVDAQGGILVADTGNHCVRRIERT